VERILADIDAMVAMVAIDFLDMAALRLTLAPSQHHSPVGQEHGRTIPLADILREQHPARGRSLATPSGPTSTLMFIRAVSLGACPNNPK
jgi:hypothetical protein